MANSDFLDQPPADDRVTPYDERHLVTYLRLLDAETDGADWQEAVHRIFGLDPRTCLERARNIHASHLARAWWMTRQGYRDLANKSLHDPNIGRDARHHQD